jgi:hypothetical protein
MPFTPFHFGVHATISLPLRKYIDIPTFILANIAVDIEPLLVILFRLNYPLHGFCHTFLIGAFIGIVLALIIFPFRKVIDKVVSSIKLEYKPALIKLILSGILGVWLHVLFDTPLYTDIKPFFPFQFNPLYNLVPASTVYWICRLAFIPAIILGVIVFIIERQKKRKT